MHDHNGRSGHSHHDHDHDHAHDHDHDHESDHEPIDWGAPLRNWRRFRVHLGVIGVVLLVWLACFTVQESEFALVTEFGAPQREVTDAGLHFKWPWQAVRYFDKRLRVHNPNAAEYLTRDKKNLLIESFALWRIAQPLAFVERVGDVEAANLRLQTIIRSGLAAAIASHDLEDIVTADADRRRTGSLLDKLASESGADALDRYGIEVLDVRIKRLNLPEQNKQSVFARMRAERERIARQYRAEGEEQALRIRAEADKQREQIVSEAYKLAEETKGAGDAEATRIYGQAYNRNPEFYKLTRTLEAYKKALDDNTTLILSSDSELLKLMTEGQ